MSLNSIRKLIRLEQWYKNLLIFVPLSFTTATHSPKLLILGFFGFSCISSITYIINDWVDREKDRAHPIKKERPLASGKISGKQATIIAIILGILVVIAGFYLGPFYSFILGSYFLITNAYSFGLKNIPLLDILIITGNFMLRMMSGMSEFPDQSTLPYFGILVGVLIIFLSHKRRSDIKLLGEKKAIKHKPVLKFYSHQNCYLIRIIGYLLLVPTFHQLWVDGLFMANIISSITLLIATSVLFSINPKLVIKPHYLFKKWLWDIILITNILVIYVTF